MNDKNPTQSSPWENIDWEEYEKNLAENGVQLNGGGPTPNSPYNLQEQMKKEADEAFERSLKEHGITREEIQKTAREGLRAMSEARGIYEYICKKCGSVMLATGGTKMKNSTVLSWVYYKCPSCRRKYTHFGLFDIFIGGVFGVMGLDYFMYLLGQQEILFDYEYASSFIFPAGILLLLFTIVYFAHAPREIVLRMTKNMKR